MSDTELSPRGRARREQILEMAIRQGRRRRRRRVTMRGAAAAAIVLVVVAIAVLRMPNLAQHPTDGPVVKSAPPSIATPGRERSKVVIERIQTDPTILQRLAVPKSPPRWQKLDDDHLLQELAQAGRPAGLVKIDGRMTLVFHRPAPGQ